MISWIMTIHIWKTKFLQCRYRNLNDIFLRIVIFISYHIKSILNQYQNNIESISNQYRINIESILNQYRINIESISNQYRINIESISNQYWINIKSISNQYWINIESISYHILSLFCLNYVISAILALMSFRR